jgi:hypothetical protein
MSAHEAEDYAFTAELLRRHTRDDKPKLFQAVCSNNLNIILSALDHAAGAPDLSSLKLAQEALTYYVRRSNPDWNGDASPESTLGQLRTAITKAEAAP